MEREYYVGRTGRTLESSDVERLEYAVLLPAMKRCEPIDTGTGHPLYYANDQAVRREDGLEYRHEFYATINKANMSSHYSIYQHAVKETTFDQLTIDECDVVIAQFQRKYENDGGKISHLGENMTWNGLYNPDVHAAISLSIISTKAFLFADNQALKSFSAKRQMRFDDTIILLDKYVLDAKSGGAMDEFLELWSPEDITTLNMSGDNMCAVTTKDMDEVVSILDDMKLVSDNDRNRFVNGI
jgi:hypothetical protein